MPLPVPLAPEVMVSQGALVAAVQVQVLALAVTLTLPVPPLPATETLVELRVKLQELAAACVTVWV